MSKVYSASTAKKNSYFSHIENKAVLDVGCGTGNLSRFLVTQGNVCTGITLSEDEAVVAREVMAETVVGDIETMAELPFSPGSFDVVVFADVLEHLRDPWKELKKYGRYLRSDGEVVVSLPNVVNIRVRIQIMLGRFRYQDYGILDNTHLRFFDRESAVDLVRSAGYRVTRVGYSNWNWHIPLLGRIGLEQLEQRFRDLLTRRWPNLLATQFFVYATSSGESGCAPRQGAAEHGRTHG